jgi:hypothetical protein
VPIISSADVVAQVTVARCRSMASSQRVGSPMTQVRSACTWTQPSQTSRTWNITRPPTWSSGIQLNDTSVESRSLSWTVAAVRARMCSWLNSTGLGGPELPAVLVSSTMSSRPPACQSWSGSAARSSPTLPTVHRQPLSAPGAATKPPSTHAQNPMIRSRFSPTSATRSPARAPAERSPPSRWAASASSFG